MSDDKSLMAAVQDVGNSLEEIDIKFGLATIHIMFDSDGRYMGTLKPKKISKNQLLIIYEELARGLRKELDLEGPSHDETPTN